MAAAAPEDDPNEEPFSPSVFLDLPPSPTPHSVGVGGEDLASSDDMVVLPPFISRMLMKDTGNNDDDMLYRPDHPALLQAAEQPSAHILSSFSLHATADATDSYYVSSSATATNTTSGSRDAFTTLVSPAFAADASWPYDPDELSQLLPSPQSTAGEEEGSELFNGGVASCCIGHQFHDGDGTAEERGRITTMDMFLKGMEEGSKFLPTTANNGELSPRVYDISSKQGVLQEGIDDGDGRTSRKKNWHGDDSWCWDDDDEAAGRRSAKLMAPETEPEGSGEAADGVILKGYEVAVEKMDGLSISMMPGAAAAGGGGGKEEKANKSQGTKQGSRRQQRASRGGNEAVDLRTLLLHCAEAMSAGNRLSATDLLRQINQRSSATGDASQRLAHCFAQGLDLRLAGGTGPGVAAKAKHTLTAGAGVEFFKAYLLYSQVCCFRLVAFKFSHMAIVKAVAGRKKVHIVDYGVHIGFHWLLLLGAWAAWEGGPPEVRITGIDFPQPGFRPAARIEETGRRLSDFARRHGVPFKFRSVVATKWETVSAEGLDIQPDEALVVNGMFHFGKLMDEGAVVGIDSTSPRDMVLVNIRKMEPDVFVLCVENSSYNTPFFVTRFREALFYYSAMFDMMDATAPRDCAERVVVEREFLGRCALNAIACEGSERVERPETYKQWQVRCRRAGMRQLPLNPGTVECLRNRVKEGYHRSFVIDEDQQWLLQGWKGRILYAMSAWAADV